jgi:hypothetical protein
MRWMHIRRCIEEDTRWYTEYVDRGVEQDEQKMMTL